MNSVIHFDLAPQETLIWFLRSRKTEISSSMSDPNIFLNNLRDHKLDERYASVICSPMWLDKVKTKLQDNEYKAVREFVHDNRLIFNICHTFNRDNKSGRMGTIMEKMFEKEFDAIFKIQ